MLFQRMEKQGDWLFRWRSYLPLGLLPVAIFFASERSSIADTPLDRWWSYFCLGLSLAGIGLRSVIAGYVPQGTSGRNTTGQIATTLNTSGMYSIVRNPLYFANFLAFAGWIFWFGDPVFLLFSFSIYALYYERIIMAEERFLAERFGQEYLRWAEATPAFFPNLTKWRTPALPFCFKTAFRRECHTQFLIVSVFVVLEAARATIDRGLTIIQWISTSPVWAVLFFVSLMMYLAGVYLKKYRTILAVEGR